ncbi:hypothetical protein BJX99DRAFT_253403 [Aspergillus californicus]
MTTISPELREALLEGPASPAPPGIVPHLGDRPSELLNPARTLLMVLWSLTFVILAIRVYTKAFIIRSFSVSDYAMIVAWAISMAFFATGWIVLDISPGTDQWNLKLKDMIDFLYWVRISIVICTVCIFFIKFSILRQFLEVFSVDMTRDYFFWTCHGIICVNFVLYTILVFTRIFPCNPVARFWDVLITEGSCMNNLLQYIIGSVLRSLMELIILVLPHLKIWKLQMSRRRKMAVSVMFIFGLLAFTGSNLAIYYTAKLYSNPDNTSHYLYMAGFLGSLPEISGGIIAGSLPSTVKFFHHIVRKLPSSASSSSPSALGRELHTGIGQNNRTQRFIGGRSFDKQFPPLTSIMSVPDGDSVDVSVGTRRDSMQSRKMVSHRDELE